MQCHSKMRSQCHCAIDVTLPRASDLLLHGEIFFIYFIIKTVAIKQESFLVHLYNTPQKNIATSKHCFLFDPDIYLDLLMTLIFKLKWNTSTEVKVR